MFRSPSLPADHPAFARLPVDHIRVGSGAHGIAVHVSGDLAREDVSPLVCIPGYQRNMSDFDDFVPLFRTVAGDTYPMVLIDLAGRGRSDTLAGKQPYSTFTDSQDVLGVLDALAIEKAIILGQGHGGQVAMVMAMQRPTALAGVILLDAGPVADPRGLVRLRNNLRHVLAIKGEAIARAALRKILVADYPGESETRLDTLIARSFWFARGRARPIHDSRLMTQLDAIEFDDILAPQWKLFDALAATPLMVARTQLSDQLRRETFDEMARRRSDAVTLMIDGQGCPALLDKLADVQPIADFVLHQRSPGRH